MRLGCRLRSRLFVCGRVLNGINFEEVVKHDQKHCQGAEKYSERVETIVGDHLEVLIGQLKRSYPEEVGSLGGSENCFERSLAIDKNYIHHLSLQSRETLLVEGDEWGEG